MIPLRTIGAGAGDPLLLLHGFGLTPLTYLRTIDKLAPSARVVAPWLRPPGQRWTFDATVASLLATLDAQGIATATVVGHSMGGAVALGLAARHPERVDELVLVNSMGLSPGRARTARLGLQASHLRRYTRYAPARDFVRWAARHPRDVAASAWWGFGADLTEPIAAVRRAGVPRSVLWGEDDSLLPLALGRRLAEALDAPFIPVARRHDGEVVEHDWVYRHPTLFTTTLASAQVRQMASRRA